MSFDGVDDYVNLGNQLDISGDFTINAYIQASNSNNVQTIFVNLMRLGRQMVQ